MWMPQTMTAGWLWSQPRFAGKNILSERTAFGLEKGPVGNKHVSQTQTTFIQQSFIGRSSFFIHGESGNSESGLI